MILCLALFSNVIAIDFDATFGSGGKFMTWFADAGQPSSGGAKVFIQGSGRLVIVGFHQQDGIQGRRSGVGLAGLTAGGVLDTGFGTAGRTLFLDAAADR